MPGPFSRAVTAAVSIGNGESRRLAKAQHSARVPTTALALANDTGVPLMGLHPVDLQQDPGVRAAGG
jgi:hypothetical protein